MADWPHGAPTCSIREKCRSRKESFLAVSWLAADGAFWLRNLRGGDVDTDLGGCCGSDSVDCGGGAGCGQQPGG